ncbi:hypothetical protein KBD81_03745 [Candidatus Woesebacteria bacterium]|nr:hypothetical protein [Candidatus Woesebacteria bacterium]
MSSSLYKPEKYKIVKGSDTQIALCTVWNDPFTLVDRTPTIKDTFALVGSLYSREGVSIMLRNLALNPDITTVFIWGRGKLSQTAIGTKGKNILLRLWDEGNGPSPENLVDIHREIEIEVLKKMMSHITFIEVSELSIDEVIEQAQALNACTTSYMKSVSFPDPTTNDDEPFPSERSNFSVRGRNLTQAWIRALDRVIRYGYLKETQVGIKQKEVVALSWTIEDTDLTHIEEVEWPPRLKERVGIDRAVLDQYATVFLDPVKPNDVSYTYGNRLRAYRGKIDQIDEMIAKLKETRITRRAFATTFDPIEDHDNPSPPCLISIQTLVADDGRLHMISYFRSHDMFKAALPNAYGLLHVMQYISEKTSIPLGTLTIHSTSAHVYEDDFSDATDLLKCGMWEKPKLYFDENEDIDPRGVVRIEILHGKLHAMLVDDAGTIRHEYTGASAREVALHFTRLGLLSRQEHIVDLTLELTKAELSLKLGKEYIQDKAIIIGKAVIK